MTNNTCTVTVTENDYTVTVMLDADGRCELSDDEGHVLGSGRWDGGSLVDCPVDLGDSMYEAIDEALSETVT